MSFPNSRDGFDSRIPLQEIILKEYMVSPDQKKVDVNNLETFYSVLKNKESSFVDIKEALFQILEKVRNMSDCFWISHAWAESLIEGKTIPKSAFPSMGVSIMHDPAWKEDEPDYKGAQITHGAEPYLITEWTKGRNHDVQPREYSNLKSFPNIEGLGKHFEMLGNGKLAMILIGYTREDDGHALLIAKINGINVIIDSSMSLGAWIKTWEDFSGTYKGRKGFRVYDYPETIHAIKG